MNRIHECDSGKESTKFDETLSSSLGIFGGFFSAIFIQFILESGHIRLFFSLSQKDVSEISRHCKGGF